MAARRRFTVASREQARQVAAANTVGRDERRTKLRTPSPTCDANAKRGTGTGVCGRPLDHLGQCDRAGNHIEGS